MRKHQILRRRDNGRVKEVRRAVPLMVTVAAAATGLSLDSPGLQKPMVSAHQPLESCASLRE